MSFYNGIFNLTNWLGNVIMPTMAGLLFAVAIVRYAKGYPWNYSMWAAVAALCVSGLLRGMETFSSQLAWNDPDLIWATLLNIVNWVGNVFLPVYAAGQAVLAVAEYVNVGHWMPGSAWLRHLVAAALCLLGSGVLRLAEFFVTNGTGGVS
jgi:hypothetical protein